MIVVERDEPAVGNRDTMGVAAEIGQDLCGSAEGPLGIDNPFDGLHGFDATSEGFEFGKRCKIAEEAQGARVEGRVRCLRKSQRKNLLAGFLGDISLRRSQNL
jgi:hypothetical protein